MATRGKLRLNVKVIPQGGNNKIESFDGSVEPISLKLRIKAPPEDGKANLELQSFLAKCLGVHKQNISLVAGHKSRNKTIEISDDSKELIAKIKNLVD
ncbi:hypothetical protein QYM36_001310 [Artemia franciscana]|uniref:Uncharacterized protein n=1 Tax=Artemia franciscana TaxID=6661 RepID=A0AA88H797_ARTSF|nr:hypothetical protein QYM36_019855 [Artemia franciscana]KAK2724776.1 hypothetical protein QYM36_001310 [Artemia franciscana]